MALESGISFATVAPQIPTDVLVGLRPLSFGAPLQFHAMPEAKPYIAEGIKSAIDSIGAGIKAKYNAKRDEQKMALESRKLDEEKRRHDQIYENTRDRFNAVGTNKAKKGGGDGGNDEDDDDEGEAPIGNPKNPGTPERGASDEVPMPNFSPEGGQGRIDNASAAAAEQEAVKKALQNRGSKPESSQKPDASPSPTSQGGMSGVLPINPEAIEAYRNRPITVLTSLPIKADALVMPEDAGSDDAAAAAAEQEVLKKALENRASNLAPKSAPLPALQGGSPAIAERAAREADANWWSLKGIPLATAEKTPPKEIEKELPPLGSPEAENDKSLEKDVKNAAKTPALLGDLGEPLLNIGNIDRQGNPLAKVQPIQKVDPSDMRYRFGKKSPALAEQQAANFNEKYPFADVQAVVHDPTKLVPYFSVRYENVSAKRREEQRKILSDAATQDIKRQRLEISKESKVKGMAEAYEKHPYSKLMDTRRDAMARMLVAVKKDRAVRNSPQEGTLPIIHQEMMDLFAQFASGKAPTEAQFHEVKTAFSGMQNGQAASKIYERFKTGQKLDERDVRTIQDLMLETYNSAAEQMNGKLENISAILKSEHPNISPIKMPVPFPLLKTKEFLQEQLHGEDLDKAEIEYATLKAKYFDEATGTLKEMPKDKKARLLKLQPIVDDYFVLKKNGYIPANEHELHKFPKKVFGNTVYTLFPGFSSSYFSSPSNSSNTELNQLVPAE